MRPSSLLPSSTPYSLFLTRYSLLLTPYSLLVSATPYSLFLIPYSLLLSPTPCSLLLTSYSLLLSCGHATPHLIFTFHPPVILFFFQGESLPSPGHGASYSSQYITIVDFYQHIFEQNALRRSTSPSLISPLRPSSSLPLTQRIDRRCMPLQNTKKSSSPIFFFPSFLFLAVNCIVYGRKVPI